MKHIITMAIAAMMVVGCAKEQTIADRAVAFIDSVSVQIKSAQSPEDLERIVQETELEYRLMTFEEELQTLIVDGDSAEYKAEYAVLDAAVDEFETLFSDKFRELYGISFVD